MTRTTPTPEVAPQGSAALGRSPNEQGAALPPGLAWWSYRAKRQRTAHIVRENGKTICGSHSWPADASADWEHGQHSGAPSCGMCLVNLKRIEHAQEQRIEPFAPRPLSGLTIVLVYRDNCWLARLPNGLVVGRKGGVTGWKVLERDMRRLAEYHTEWWTA